MRIAFILLLVSERIWVRSDCTYKARELKAQSTRPTDIAMPPKIG
jgi:hypothetical protein